MSRRRPTPQDDTRQIGKAILIVTAFVAPIWLLACGAMLVGTELCGESGNAQECAAETNAKQVTGVIGIVILMAMFAIGIAIMIRTGPSRLDTPPPDRHRDPSRSSSRH